MIQSDDESDEWQKAIEAHAAYLGMDLDTDSEFLWYGLHWCAPCRPARVNNRLINVALRARLMAAVE